MNQRILRVRSPIGMLAYVNKKERSARARAAVKARYARMTAEELSAMATKMARAKHAALTPEERSANAKLAAEARWSGKPKP